MTEPAYRDITSKDVALVQEEKATVRVLSGAYRGREGAVKGEFVKVQYLDINLEANAIWSYNESPNDHTLFLYLIDGNLAADEALEQFEEQACAILMSSSSDKTAPNDQVQVKAGPHGVRFFLIAAKPLHEAVSWGGPIVMNTREELDLAFEELEKGTFIKHARPKML
jgi:redox-sensitive bicupin YhaK (pirin superfamily)